MKTDHELLREVIDFVDKNLGKKFVIKEGVYKEETVTIAGYTEKDGLGEPSVIVELPDTLPMNDHGWKPGDKEGLYDRIILDADPMQSYWYVDIEDIEEC